MKNSIDNISIRKRNAVFNSASFMALLIYIYSILSDPFIFLVYLPNSIRALILIIPLLFIVYAVVSKTNVGLKVYLFIYVLLMLAYLLNTLVISGTAIKNTAQFLFLISLFALRNQNKLTNKLIVFWFWLWIYISFCIITSYVVFKSNIMTFSPKVLLEGSENADYYYNHIPILGNFVNYTFLGVHVPKSSWYAFEPGMLSYFFGFNLLLSRYLPSTTLSAKKISIFKIVNMLAGLFTFSTTYILFLLLYCFLSIYRRFNNYIFKVCIVTISLLSLIFIVGLILNSGILATTSLGDRYNRILFGMSMISELDIFGFLFGSGFNSSVSKYGAGLSSGLLSIFIEQGFVLFIFTMMIIYKFTYRKIDLFYYIIFYLLTFNPVYYPMSAVGFFIAYNTSRVNRSDV